MLLQSHIRTLGTPNTKLRMRVNVARLFLLALLILALLGGVFHHHQSGSDCAACMLCQGAVQTPDAELAGHLGVPLFKPVGFLSPAAGQFIAGLAQFAPLVPRAPPSPIPLAMFREGGAAGA